MFEKIGNKEYDVDIRNGRVRVMDALDSSKFCSLSVGTILRSKISNELILQEDIDNFRKELDDLSKIIESAKHYINTKDKHKGELNNIELFRYLRPRWLHAHQNLGGITFLIKFTNGINQNKMKFTYAICHDEDNFNKDTGRNICMEKMAYDYYTEISYNRYNSLIENIYFYLKNKDTLTKNEKLLFKKMCGLHLDIR